MKAVVIGGTGHIGTYLCPRLWDAGYDVTVVTRGKRKAYLSHPAWEQVTVLEVDRDQAEKEGVFGSRIAELEPDIVIDLISFELDSTKQLCEALRGKVRHFLHCGTIWVKGYLEEAPTREDSPSEPIGEYGTKKRAIEDYLLSEARRGNLPATMVNPGHIVGPGYTAINPVGNHNPEVFARLARGEQLLIPNFGMETLHHVHADDVAQAFMRAIGNWSLAVGEQFFAVSPAAVTLRGFAAEVACWFSREADLAFCPWEEWKSKCGLPESDIEMTHSHLSHGQCCSIEKAQRLLDYQPRYTSFEAVREAVDWLIANGELDIRRSI